MTPDADGPRDTDIAIIGMACRFPGADDLDSFWRNLCEGVESIRDFSEAELTAAGVPEAVRKAPNYVARGAVLSDVEGFDAPLFDVPASEAALLDPQHRLFLETAWTALEHAGWSPAGFSGAIGCYGGGSLNSYLLNNLAGGLDSALPTALYQAIMANAGDFLATRVAYKLDLKGPAVSVQTACSTSLVAVHMACQSLLNGECDMALAGGVSVRVPQTAGYLHEPGMIFSPDGHCRAFDAAARGMVAGSGAGVVVLKRLAEALDDGDTIHAVIRGSAINNDGALKAGYSAPSIDGQARVIAEAQSVAGVEPDSIGYIEAHGTGTELGDPIEVAALTRAFGDTARRQFCTLSSVKTNIGHLDAAAGVAGLIKAVLALRHREWPPSLHFTAPNPRIDFAASPFFVNAERQPWPAGPTPRRAGVSSFGIGGTNAHVVLEEAPAPAPAAATGRRWHLLPLSARTAEALDRLGTGLAGHLDRHPELAAADVAATLAFGRTPQVRRSFVVCRDAADGAAQLRGGDPLRRGAGSAAEGSRSVAFLFSGQGSQYPGMALGAYRYCPVFRDALDDCCDRLRGNFGLDLRRVLYDEAGEAAAARLNRTALTQPALFAVEYALACQWQDWGIRPDALLGHSVGEYVAACLAGVFGLDDALALVAERGRLMQGLPPGAMLTVPLTEEEAAPLCGTDLAIAALNGPAQTVLSGPVPAIEAVQRLLAGRGIEGRRLETSHAFHSPMMDLVLAEFTEAVRRVERRPPDLPFLSNVTGTWIRAEEAGDPAYWARHLHGTVRFADGLGVLLEEPRRVLLEVGPGRPLTGLARRHPDFGDEHRAIASLPAAGDKSDADAALLAAAGHLWLAGLAPDWHAVQAPGRHVPLPTYPFERRRYWTDPAPARPAPAETRPARPALADWFFLPSWQQALPPRAGQDAGIWLLFADRRGLAVRLAELAAQTVLVQAGSGPFQRLTPDRFVIDPANAGHYHTLLATLAGEDRAPARIVHAWSLDITAQSVAEARTLGLDSLLHLARALAAAGGPADLAIVSDGAQTVTGAEPVRPELALLTGAVRVIPQEYPQIRCSAIDLWLDGRSPDRTAAETLHAELTGGDQPDSAWRNGWRWLPHFPPAPLAEPDRPMLRDGGVYLITGGFGGIAQALATGLARAVKARLVLVGRSDLPAETAWDAWLAGHDADEPTARRIRVVRALQALGAEVLPVTADIGDPAALAAALAAAERRFGALHGVIHTAGIKELRAIQDLGPGDIDRLLHAKVAGIQSLDAALGNRALDFCLIVSSLSAVVGALGQAAYTAAHAYMDAYVLHRRRRDGNWIAVDWDNWLVAEDGTGDLPAGEPFLTAAEGFEAFRRIVGSTGLGRVVVSTAPLAPRLERWVHLRGLHGPAEPAAGETAAERQARHHPRPPLSTEYSPPETPTEQALAGLWENLLALRPIGRHDNFFELGADSMTGLQLTASAHKAGLRIALKQVFDHPTVAELAAVLDSATGSEGMAGREEQPAEGPVPLTSMQRWFLAQNPPRPDYFNQAVLLTVPEDLDDTVLARTLAALAERHDALRLRVERTADGTWAARIVPPAVTDWPLDLVDLTEPGDLTARAAALHGRLDLAAGPIARAALFRLNGRPWRLLLSLHHFAVDIPSWRILAEDLQLAYGQLAAGRPPALAAPGTSFGQWARHQSVAETDDAVVEPACLPRDDDAANCHNAEASVGTELSATVTSALLRDLPQQFGVRTIDVLTAALAETLAEWTGAPTVQFDLEGHGRDTPAGDADLSRTVGWFTRLQTVTLTPPVGAEARTLLSAIRTQLAMERRQRTGRSEVVLLYLGAADTGSVAPGSRFHPAPEAIGPTADPAGPRGHVLEFRCRVQGDRLRGNRLRIEAVYARNLHRCATIEAVLTRFAATLDRLAVTRPAAHRHIDILGTDLDEELDNLISQLDLDE
jgi:acyl transferase domain-containing protein